MAEDKMNYVFILSMENCITKSLSCDQAVKQFAAKYYYRYLSI